jgi:AICAR transformylase/IMP cyclohydrolase PurH
MGFFSFVQEIAMDLGTANTIIISDDKIVVDEPSVVALDRRTDKMIAVGAKANKKGAVTDLADRKMFAERAFGVSSHYDTAIHNWFAGK